jgi:hypothetical protein
MDTQSARRGRSDVVGEEDPDMAAITRSRTLQQRGNTHDLGGIAVGECVQCPTGTIKVTGEQTTSVPMKQWIDPDVHLTREVALQNFSAER